MKQRKQPMMSSRVGRRNSTTVLMPPAVVCRVAYSGTSSVTQDTLWLADILKAHSRQLLHDLKHRFPKDVAFPNLTHQRIVMAIHQVDETISFERMSLFFQKVLHEANQFLRARGFFKKEKHTVELIIALKQFLVGVKKRPVIIKDIYNELQQYYKKEMEVYKKLKKDTCALLKQRQKALLNSQQRQHCDMLREVSVRFWQLNKHCNQSTDRNNYLDSTYPIPSGDPLRIFVFITNQRKNLLQFLVETAYPKEAQMTVNILREYIKVLSVADLSTFQWPQALRFHCPVLQDKFEGLRSQIDVKQEKVSKLNLEGILVNTSESYKHRRQVYFFRYLHYFAINIEKPLNLDAPFQFPEEKPMFDISAALQRILAKELDDICSAFVTPDESSYACCSIYNEIVNAFHDFFCKRKQINELDTHFAQARELATTYLLQPVWIYSKDEDTLQIITTLFKFMAKYNGYLTIIAALNPVNKTLVEQRQQLYQRKIAGEKTLRKKVRQLTKATVSQNEGIDHIRKQIAHLSTSVNYSFLSESTHTVIAAQHECEALPDIVLNITFARLLLVKFLSTTALTEEAVTAKALLLELRSQLSHEDLSNIKWTACFQNAGLQRLFGTLLKSDSKDELRWKEALAQSAHVKSKTNLATLEEIQTFRETVFDVYLASRKIELNNVFPDAMVQSIESPFSIS